jgi:Flp pilus assembly pilin Flp
MNLLLTVLLLLATFAVAAWFSRASALRRLRVSQVHDNPQQPDSGADNQHGQATTEYALVLLGAGLIALILITWATTGGAEGRIGQLFDSVIDTITSRI